MISPTFKVRDFAIQDVSPYAVKARWDPHIPEEDNELILFPKHNTLPSTKLLTVFESADFQVQLSYAEPKAWPRPLGLFLVKGAKPTPDGTLSTVKVKARLDQNGIMQVESAHLYEQQEAEAPAEDASANDEVKKEAPKKTKAKKTELPVEKFTTALAPSVISTFQQAEVCH